MRSRACAASAKAAGADEPPDQVGPVDRDRHGDGRTVGVRRQDDGAAAVPFDQPHDGGRLVVEVEVGPEADRGAEAE